MKTLERILFYPLLRFSGRWNTWDWGINITVLDVLCAAIAFAFPILAWRLA